ncbi:MAG: hypothetical protein AAFY29_23045 [Pseudomonadota bacterium]
MDDSEKQNRRRLLKASVAAPVIATLHPSSAMAMSSASYACIAEPGDSAITVKTKVWKRRNWAPDHLPERLYKYEGHYFREIDEHDWEPYYGDLYGDRGSDDDDDDEPYYRETKNYHSAVAGYDLSDPSGPYLIGPKPAYGGDPVSESCLNSLIFALSDPI